jgi:hypothetical protein
MNSGDHVLLDGKTRAIVRSVWPVGSTSFAFPHARIDFSEGDRDVAVALKRLTVVSEPVKMTDIGNGHFVVTDRVASQLAKAAGYPLPKPGFEALVETGGLRYWLKRTMVMGMHRWALMGPTSWRMEGGRLISKGEQS